MVRKPESVSISDKQTVIPFPEAEREGTVFSRFLKIARLRGDEAALIDGGTTLSYAELLERVWPIAAAVKPLQAAGPVALFLDHGVEYPIAILGVLAAGRGCVLLDADQPAARNQVIAEQSGAIAVVTTEDHLAAASNLFGRAVPVIDLDGLPAAGTEAMATGTGPDDLTFIIYTSGSTGTPKGVFQNNRGELQDLRECIETERLGPGDRLPIFYAPTVASSLRVTLSALLSGGTLCLYYPRDMEPAQLAEIVRRDGITVFRSVPALFRHVVDALGPGDKLETLRLVLLGGDRVDWTDVDAFRRACRDDAELLIVLGGTETWTLHILWFFDGKLVDRSEKLPVGRAVPTRRVTLVDDAGNPVPVGEVGEIVVNSRFLALGYWRNPEATARAFSVDPEDPGKRSFRTGDLARLRPDGLIEYAGRKDFQIKLAGHRIEPGEVENAFREIDGVDDAAVIVRRGPDGAPKAMVAYLTTGPRLAGAKPRHLLWMIARRLPAHMVPAVAFLRDDLPRLGNMKIDRKALAVADGEMMSAGADDGSPLIRDIIDIFEKVVGLGGATPEDNLASMGGNSLNAVEIALEIERAFKIPMGVEMFRSFDSIRELAAGIEESQLVYRPSSSQTEEFGLVDHLHLRILPMEDGREVRRHRRAMIDAFESGGTFDTDGQAQDWSAALTQLFLGSRIDVLSYGLPGLVTAREDLFYPKDLLSFVQRVPAPTALSQAFQDNLEASVQVCPKDGAETIIFCFCDALHGLGMPLPVLHRWMSRLNASIVYLRDFSKNFYLSGVSELSSDYIGTVSALRDIARSLGARHIACHGGSAGAFGAIRYGSDLRAQSVMVMAGPTNLDPAFNTRLRTLNLTAEVRSRLPDAELDLKRVLHSAEWAPKTTIVVATGNWDDRIHGEWLDPVPSVELDLIPDFDGHNVAIELVKRGLLDRYLRLLV